MAGQRQSSLIDVDASDFLAGLATALNEMEFKSEAGLYRFATKIANGAKRYCPVDTGRLKSSIATVKGTDGKGPYVDVGTEVEYAPAIEFGHKQEVGRYVPAIKKRLVKDTVPAQPFMRPAIAEAIPTFVPTMRYGK